MNNSFFRLSLEVTLENARNGYWDGGLKDIFTLELIRPIKQDSKGWYQRVDCFQANYWFCVGAGKTKIQSDKQILKTALRKMFKGQKVVSMKFF